MTAILESLQQLRGHHPAWIDVPTLLASACLVIASWRWRERKPALSGVLLAATALLIGLAMSADPLLHPWDERFHALVAKNLLRHPLTPTLYDTPLLQTDTWWGSTRIWLHKPPLTLWLIAASYRLFGAVEMATRLPSVLLLGCAVYSTHWIGVTLFSPRVAWFAAALHATNGRALEIAAGRTSTDHPDSILASLTAIAVAVGIAQRRSRNPWLTLALGLVVGAALLTKWLPGLLALGLWAVWLPWRGQPRRSALEVAAVTAIASVVALPWQVHIAQSFPVEAAVESAYNWIHLRQPLEGHSGTPFFHLARIPLVFGEAAYLPLLWFAYRHLRRGASESTWLLVLWFAVPYGFFALAATKMANYVLPAAPALFLMLGVVLVEWLGALTTSLGTWRRRALLLALVATVFFPIRSTFDRWKPFKRFAEAADRSERLRSEARRLHPRPYVVFNAPDPIQTMFYGASAAYSFPPTDDHLRLAQQRGWIVLVR